MSETSTFAIRQLARTDEPQAVAFFSAVSSDPDVARFFNPHPLDAQNAARVIDPTGTAPDVYFGAFEGAEMVGYGMLRGWSEGYEVPAFGVCVRPDQRGKRIGGMLLDWAIARAEERGAPAVMLKVSAENFSARKLYESRGFEFGGEVMDAQLVGRLTLNP